MTVTISFLVLPGDVKRVRTIIFETAPEYKSAGDHADLALHEVLEFLSRIGVSEQESKRILELVLREPITVKRKRFDLNPAQVAAARHFFPGDW